MDLNTSRLQLSSRFVSLTGDLLGKSGSTRIFESPAARTLRARGLAFKVPKMTAKVSLEEEYAKPPYYPGEVLVDLASLGAGMAPAVGKPELAEKYRELRRDAAEIVSEEDLLSRYADYQNAIASMISATEMLRDVSERINSGLGAGGKESWTSEVKDILTRMRTLVGTAFGRLFYGFESTFSGFRNFLKHLGELTRNIAGMVKEKVVMAFEKLVQSVGTLFGQMISSLFGWLASVKRIASDRGFTLSEVTVKLGQVSIESIPLLGMSIPMPKISTPEVSMKFT